MFRWLKKKKGPTGRERENDGLNSEELEPSPAHNYTPVLFDFARPVGKSFIETVGTLAGMSRFVVADMTNAFTAKRFRAQVGSALSGAQKVLRLRLSTLLRGGSV